MTGKADLILHLHGHCLRPASPTIDDGCRWPTVIRDKVDFCAALVVMTPAAEESEWVGREIHRAESKGKPILPRLLDGDAFFRLGETQYEPVVGGKMPSKAFVQRLRRLASG
jgi:hypothetical protein